MQENVGIDRFDEVQARRNWDKYDLKDRDFASFNACAVSSALPMGVGSYVAERSRRNSEMAEN
jgi:hypothetical protein